MLKTKLIYKDELDDDNMNILKELHCDFKFDMKESNKYFYQIKFLLSPVI